ncbi:DSS1/SEM1 family protein [Cryptosporidium felis]|nr:DSS1/SEM1 family protein [Cryptosporidium felis]
MSSPEETKNENINSFIEEMEDELEEFDDLENVEAQIDPDVTEWDENWDTSGWDDEDADDEFIKQLHHELQEFEKKQANANK